jgi:hypothetical protein
MLSKLGQDFSLWFSLEKEVLGLSADSLVTLAGGRQPFVAFNLTEQL